jgi:hypothetical protein
MESSDFILFHILQLSLVSYFQNTKAFKDNDKEGITRSLMCTGVREIYITLWAWLLSILDAVVLFSVCCSGYFHFLIPCRLAMAVFDIIALTVCVISVSIYICSETAIVQGFPCQILASWLLIMFKVVFLSIVCDSDTSGVEIPCSSSDHKFKESIPPPYVVILLDTVIVLPRQGISGQWARSAIFWCLFGGIASLDIFGNIKTDQCIGLINYNICSVLFWAFSQACYYQNKGSYHFGLSWWKW